ncbi:DNA/RNA non-specific endonuclease [Flavobacterium okayamense]|uniref:Endonuclease n=1 Tax=Flavobacterium okayamense TaxID=2830782 RepID=A0ABM7S832_9FLAO|nr:DNA/RNA non-specific endonuclease [Flavobacterium okayamense]BCY27495.1 endonuclease [Flavobacterium okayamense]
MNFNKILLLFVFLLFVIACKEVIIVEDDSSFSSNETVGEFNYLPTNTTNAVYTHNTYTLSYAEEFEQAEWVAYYLDKEDIKYINYKRPLFEVDDEVITGSAHWRNFKNSGYNKGHLLPAGDRRASYEEFEETFLTSNISPQKYKFNSGIWNRLEQKVRYWAGKYDGLYVVTAGVLSSDLETIGYEDVAVPKYFYKVLLTNDRTRMIGFLVPHKDSNKPLYEFVVSVDSIEKITGLDFFPELEDTLESQLESNSSYKDWSF